jgi:hypothetical protein
MDDTLIGKNDTSTLFSGINKTSDLTRFWGDAVMYEWCECICYVGVDVCLYVCMW